MSKMKYILPLLFCLFTTVMYSQQNGVGPGPDTSGVITRDSLVVFTRGQVVTLANKIRLLQDSISYHRDLINGKDSLISLYEQRSVVFRNQIQNRDETIKLFEEQEKVMRKTIIDLQPNWYDSKPLWFGAGVGSTILLLLLLQK